MGRVRAYELFGVTARGPYSVYTSAFARGTRRYVVRVRAHSIRQAYTLAASGVWAAGPTQIGVERAVGLDGEVARAPYLEGTAA